MEALNQFGKFDIRKPLTEKKETDERTVPRRSIFFDSAVYGGKVCFATRIM